MHGPADLPAFLTKDFAARLEDLEMLATQTTNPQEGEKQSGQDFRR